MRKSLRQRMLSILTGIVLIISWISFESPLYAEEPKPVRIERTVSTTVTEVGEVFKVNYRIYGDEIKIPRPVNEIAVIIDTSGSMAWTLDGQNTNDVSRQRITIAKNGAKNFIENFNNTNTKIFIVPFESQVRGISAFENMEQPGSLNRLNTYIDQLRANGGTNLGDSFRVAYHTLEEKGSDTSRKHIVVLTDGDPTFYTYTGYINGSNFSYYLGKGLVGSVYGVKTNNSNDYNRGFDYAEYVGQYLKNKRTESGKQKFNFHIIGFADNSESLDNKLNQIGMICGAEPVPSNSNKHYYKALTENDLKEAYDAIWRRITQPIAFGTLHFEEILPEDVVLTPESERMLLEDPENEFVIKKIIVDGKERVQISGNLTGSMEYIRSEPDGDVYQLREQLLSFEISVRAEKGGEKLFEKEVTTIDYVYFLPDSPDQPISGRASNQTEFVVTVNLKDTQLEMTGSLDILQGCTADLAAEVTKGDPNDVTVDTWSSNDDGEIIEIEPKGINTAAITGLKKGSTVVTATTKSAKGWYKTATADCKVNVIGVETRNIYLLKGSTDPEEMSLKKYLIISHPEDENFNVDNISLMNVNANGMEEYLQVSFDSSKNDYMLRGIKATGDTPVTLTGTIKYGKQSRNVEWKVYVLDAEITPETLNVELWGSGQFSISYILPELDENETYRIKNGIEVSWSYSGEKIAVTKKDDDIDGKIDKLLVKGLQLTESEEAGIVITVSFKDGWKEIPLQKRTTTYKVIVRKSAVDIQ